MIITISGLPGSGKSTAGKLLAKLLGFRHFSSGDFMREIAAKRGVSLNELGKLAEKDRSIDQELDERTKKLGKDNDDFVMDSRLAYYFIPGSFKIFLEVDEKEAAKRILGAINNGSEGRKVEKESTNLASTIDGIRERLRSEKQRYKNYYNLDPYDLKLYDLVVDTTNCTPEEVIEKIVESIKKRAACC
jgi:CMP/dCMP kinase